MATVRYRPRLRQLPWYLFLLPVLQLIWPPNPDARPVSRTFWVVVFTIMAAELAFLGRMGAELRPDTLVLRGFRTRVVPWSDIIAMSKTRMFGTRYVTIHTPGDRWRLRAPTHTPIIAPDREFDAKADTIWRYWAANRGVPDT